MSLRRLVGEARDNTAKGNMVGLQETVARVRIRRDLETLQGVLAKVAQDPNDFYTVHVTVHPSHGIYAGGMFSFRLNLSEQYPQEGPKIRYTGPSRIYHPNIEGEDLQQLQVHGRPSKDWGVCGGVQRDWTERNTLTEVILGLENMFEMPNYDDSLPGVARKASEVLRQDPNRFAQIAKEWMNGDYHRVE